MDGHERDDVRKYHQEVFLSIMAQYECRMVHYEPTTDSMKLKCIKPNLKPGEKKIIVLFHDESCFHANEYKQSSW
jgi:hypothetical protein